jgi:hypothetical protein
MCHIHELRKKSGREFQEYISALFSLFSPCFLSIRQIEHSEWYHLLEHRWDKKSPYRKIGTHNPYKLLSYRDNGPYRKLFFPIGALFVPRMKWWFSDFLLECLNLMSSWWCGLWSPDSNLKFLLQVQVEHSNIGGIELFLPGWDKFSIFVEQYYYFYVPQSSIVLRLF